MALVIFDIGYFKNKALSKDALLYLAQILEFFSEHERDVILRPVYDRVGKGRQHEPETFEQVMMHLQHGGSSSAKCLQCCYLSGTARRILG